MTSKGEFGCGGFLGLVVVILIAGAVILMILQPVLAQLLEGLSMLP